MVINISDKAKVKLTSNIKVFMMINVKNEML